VAQSVAVYPARSLNEVVQILTSPQKPKTFVPVAQIQDEPFITYPGIILTLYLGEVVSDKLNLYFRRETS